MRSLMSFSSVPIFDQNYGFLGGNDMYFGG